jgi:glycine C-acetyltransferase/8-amino-7-oxononanoate synthase
MRTFSSELEQLESEHLRRRLESFQSTGGPGLSDSAGRPLTGFASNDYLGFAGSEILRSLLSAAVAQWPVGAGASRAVVGTQPAHRELEAAIAELKGTAAAVAFSSGYAAAVGTMGAVLRAGDIVILDKLSHASLIDGARLSGATIRVFPHNDMDRLRRHLAWARRMAGAGARVLVVTESVFSMDGDRARLSEVVQLKQEAGAILLLDEAHAFGVIGPGGRGLAHELGLADQIDISLGTLSKAAGLQGGFVAGGQDLADLIVNRARSFLYSTAPLPPVAAVAAEMVRRVLPGPHGESARARLTANLRLFAQLTGSPEPESPVIPVILGSESAALAAAAQLRAEGLLVPAIRYPTVARGQARLRVSLTASHAESDIRKLVAALQQLGAMASAGRGRGDGLQQDRAEVPERSL